MILAGCGDATGESDTDTASAPPIPVAPATPPEGVSIPDLREKLGANANARFIRDGGEITQADLFDSGADNLSALKNLPLIALGITGLDVRDLSPLEGMQLELLTAEETPIDDVSVLSGMPLRELYLRKTNVKSLEPLRDCPLEFLNVVGTPVDDLSPLKGIPLNTLWVASTPVSDLTPLEGSGLISLDIENTPVDNLDVVATLSALQRLNIKDSAVTDLTPLAGLKLQRLIFTPSRIERGIEVVREMPSLQSLGIDFDHVQEQQSAAEFWADYDAGKFAAE